MNTNSHSKCHKCNKTLPVAGLKDNPDGVGKICTDSEACNQRKEKSDNAVSPK